MDSLDDTNWDVVISGTGLPQSLLALALSRSGKKILHVDRNGYYGGDEAALSLSDAGIWAQKHAGSPDPASSSFSHATITTIAENVAQNKLSHARAYSLALAPQLLYTRSNLLPALVSSKTHGQLEFQAVGSWFIVETSQNSLTRVPGGREDIFQDNTLDLKAKRSLMKFLRFVTNFEEQPETWQADRTKPFSSFLQERFGLPPASHAPILALALSMQTADSTTVEYALPQIAFYLRGIGLFGSGFGALLPKWGGLAEVSQVACRAGAVGGGVYVLGKAVNGLDISEEAHMGISLSGGEKITTQWLAGVPHDLPGATASSERSEPTTTVTKSITIVASNLTSLFPPTSEGGVTPAGAVVLVETGRQDEPPVHILVHSSESGECPSGQSVLYASVAQNQEEGFARLDDGVSRLLQSTGEHDVDVLWRLHYRQDFEASVTSVQEYCQVLTLPPLTSGLVVDNTLLENVKLVWQRITGDDPETFLEFEAREGATEDDDFFGQ